MRSAAHYRLELKIRGLHKRLVELEAQVAELRGRAQDEEDTYRERTGGDSPAADPGEVE